jgi:hypothetical protein
MNSRAYQVLEGSPAERLRTSVGSYARQLHSERVSIVYLIAADRAAVCVQQANDQGAFGFILKDVFHSVPFSDDFPFQQQLYASVIHQLIMLFLDAPVGRCDLVFVEVSAVELCVRSLGDWELKRGYRLRHF